MNRRISTALLLPAGLGLLACSANPVPEPLPVPKDGRVVNTIDEEVGWGIEPAHIYEIDGRPVMYQKRTFSLPAGEHTIRVWPEGPAQRMVPDLEAIERQQIQVDPLDVVIEPGHRYFIGARQTKTREVVTVLTDEGEEQNYGDWKITIEPVVVKVVLPPDLERVATGLGGFMSTFLIGPVLAGM
ncbi:MAG: hypothetical protein GY769_20645 [bacterium]|nr:hypothetical protein [bacterium]